MILDHTLRDFASALAARTPAPGGGAAAGYMGALGAALAEMAMAYSMDEKNATEKLKAAATSLEGVRGSLLVLSEEDCRVYDRYTRARGLPRQTADEKKLRKTEIAGALEEALRVPLEGANLCLEGLRELEAVSALINPRLITDLGIATRCLGAAFRSCWFNVRVNARSLKDNSRAAELEAREKLLSVEFERLEKSCYQCVEAGLAP